MKSFPPEEIYTERVYIDPERLLRLKKERKTFKHVPSIFEPPPEPEEVAGTELPSVLQQRPSVHADSNMQ
jgi:hypothetical protein